MKSSTTFGRQKAAIGVGAVLLLAASLITVSSVVGAQATGSFAGDGPDDFNPLAYCSSDSILFGSPGETPAFFGSADDGNHLLSSDVPGNGSTQLAPVALALPAGTYSLLGVASDAYPTRGGVSQSGEQWFAEFVDADGAVVGTSASTPDVPDLSVWGIVSEPLGEVTLSGDAAAVVIKHSNPGTASPNSVRAICMDVELVSLATSIESSITVDYDSENIDEETISVVCGDDELQSDQGTAVDLGPNAVTPGETCTVTYPADQTCTVTVTPADGVTVTDVDGVVTVEFPADVSVDAVVDIDCNAGGVDCADADAAAAAAAAGDDSCDVAVNCDDADEAAAAAAAGDTSCDVDVLNETVTNPETPVDTEVLQEVVDAPVAQSQSGDPTFTG